MEPPNSMVDVYRSVFVHRPRSRDAHRHRRPAVVAGDGRLGVANDAVHEGL